MADDSKPTPAELEQMRQTAEEARQRKASKEAYDKASPIGKSIPEKKARGGSIRGGGCEQRGKTRGRMR